MSNIEILDIKQHKKDLLCEKLLTHFFQKWSYYSFSFDNVSSTIFNIFIIKISIYIYIQQFETLIRFVKDQFF